MNLKLKIPSPPENEADRPKVRITQKNTESLLKRKSILFGGKITPTSKPRNRHLESDLQKECVKWFRYQYSNYRLRLMKFGADSNLGFHGGHRLKLMSYQAGSPDLLLAVPRLHYGGMFIEIKIKGGNLSKDQKVMHKELGNDYKVVLVWSFDEFKSEIENYLK